MQDQILDMLLKEDEITWQTILYDLIKTEQMNPWDIDLSVLSQKYLETIKKLQGTNFFISGKVILAAALLLRIKSDKLMSEDLAFFDSLLFHRDEEVEELGEIEEKLGRKDIVMPKLTVKTPLARKRKVSINDLVKALEKALEVDKRRTLRILESKRIPENLVIPERKVDITALIKQIYGKIINFFKAQKHETLTFEKLVNSDRKEDKLLTFIPLLHLDNQEKIYLNQEQAFGEIKIGVVK